MAARSDVRFGICASGSSFVIVMKMFVRIGEMHVAFSEKLSQDVIQSEKQEHASSDAGEPVADCFIQAGPKPRNQQAK